MRFSKLLDQKFQASYLFIVVLLQLVKLVKMQDIDECSMHIDNCHTNASCTNTPESFICACNDGFTGNGVNCSVKTIEKGEKGGVVVNFTVIYRRNPNITKLIVVGEKIKEEINETGKIGEYSVIGGVDNGTCDKCLSLENSLCLQWTVETIICLVRCTGRYYNDGDGCKEFTVIQVEVSLEKEFADDLKNSSSSAYKELAQNITADLYETFKDTPNFQEVRVVRFRNGSTIVEFVVLYRQGKMTKTVVGEKVRKEIIETGKLGGYPVTGGVVKGPPPAPEEFKNIDVTENRIELQWKKPRAHLAFVIDGYTVGHRKEAETTFKTERFVGDITNSVLSDLESDTFYVITVYGYNDEGNGEKLEMQVSTKKSGSLDLPVVIIVVVIIVVVLLFIIGMVIYFCLRKRIYLDEVRQQANAQKQQPTTINLAPVPSTSYDNYG